MPSCRKTNSREIGPGVPAIQPDTKGKFDSLRGRLRNVGASLEHCACGRVHRRTCYQFSRLLESPGHQEILARLCAPAPIRLINRFYATTLCGCSRRVTVSQT